MIQYEWEYLYEKSSIHKSYTIYVYNNNTLESLITNAELYSEEIEHYNPLCTEESLTIGSCEASYIKFKVVNTVGTLKNKKIKVFQTPSDPTDSEVSATPLQIGEFYVDSDELAGDRQSREIIAYDILYKIINTDMNAWYHEVGLPMTMKDFRDAFFENFGVTQETVSLCNDDMVITETIIAEQLPGIDVLNAICAGNGVFGTINNEGKFKYVDLSNATVSKAYGKSYKQGTLGYEDYSVRQITSLKFYSNNDLDITVGSGNNQYIMEDNFLFYDKLENILTVYVERIFNVIKNIPAYRPLKVEVYGDPCIEVGDLISFTTTSGQIVQTFVLDKVEKGLQALTDTFETDGTEYYEYDLTSNNSQIRRLWNNTLALQEEANAARTYVYAQRNNKKYTIGSNAETTIIKIKFATVDKTIPVFLATIPLEMSLDGEVKFRYYLDGIEINTNDKDTIYLTKGKQFVTLSTFFEMEKDVQSIFTVTAQAGYRESENRKQDAKIISLKDWIDNQSISVSTSGGVTTAEFNYDYVEHPIDTTPPGITIAKGTIRAMVFGSGLAPSDVWDGNLLIVDTVEDWLVSEITFEEAFETITLTSQAPTAIVVTDYAPEWSTNEIAFEDIYDRVQFTIRMDSRPRITEDGKLRITEDGSTRYTEGD